MTSITTTNATSQGTADVNDKYDGSCDVRSGVWKLQKTIAFIVWTISKWVTHYLPPLPHTNTVVLVLPRYPHPLGVVDWSCDLLSQSCSICSSGFIQRCEERENVTLLLLSSRNVVVIVVAVEIVCWVVCLRWSVLEDAPFSTLFEPF